MFKPGSVEDRFVHWVVENKIPCEFSFQVIATSLLGEWAVEFDEETGETPTFKPSELFLAIIQVLEEKEMAKLERLQLIALSN